MFTILILNLNLFINGKANALKENPRNEKNSKE